MPEARVAVAHGQMDEGTLEQVVLDFWEGEYDVLVCTTIIESGIDMPTVNTLVVDRADLLGLGQLHQLRGRVGRAGQRAYAYLFHPPDRALTEEAYERLKTIGEATELGSGFKIAMRDLEIRGAGNLLGAEPVGPHRRGRLRPLLPDGHRGGGRAEGRAGPRAGRGQARPAGRRQPPARTTWPSEELRLEAYRRLAAVTTARRGRRHPRRVGRPLRPGAGARRGAPWRGPPAGRVFPDGNLRFRSRPVVPGGSAPLWLKTSVTIRLRRLARDAVYKEEQGQLVVPLKRGVNAAYQPVALLGDLVPPTPNRYRRRRESISPPFLWRARVRL